MGHRSITLLVSAFLAFASSGVWALGLGKITLDSTLNQPISAEIELFEVRDLTLSEIKVAIASREDFERIGVDKTYFLSDLKFEVVLSGPRSPYIKVTSSKAVREPFLNFVLQVQWPSGKLLREYTVLLDLPAFSDQPAQAVKPSASAPARPTTQSSQAPSPRDTATTSYNPRSAYESAPARPSPASSARPVTPSYTEDSYRVRANDTLWEIAASVRPSGDVSIHQTMLALQRANPEAFINNNINLLKEGQILRIPEADEMAQMSQREAVREVAQQNSAWSGGRGGELADAQLSASDTYDDTRSTRGSRAGRVKLTAPDEAYNSTEGRGAGGADEVSTEALENELAATLEQLDKSSRDNSELRSKIASLEEQISTMERMLKVSNESLRAMELAAAQQAQAVPSEETTEAAVEGETATPAAEAPAVDLAAELEASQAATEAESGGTTEDTLAEASPEPSPEPTKAADPTRVVVSPPAPPKKSIVDIVLENIYYIVGGLLAVAVAVFFIMKKRAEDEEDFDEFMEQHGLVAEEDDSTVIQHRKRDAAEDEEELDLGDFGDVDEEASLASLESTAEEEPLSSEAETEDVVAEADIYIAYGKYDQAEDMLVKALNKDAGDTDVRLKLLEVYSLQGDAQSFDPHFAKLLAIAGPALIERAKALRSNIPNVPPFDEDGFGEETLGSEEGAGDFDLDMPETAGAMDDGLDLDLGDLDSDGDPDSALDLDLDLGDEPSADDDDGLALDLDITEDGSDEDLALDLDLTDDSGDDFGKVSLDSSDDSDFGFDLEGGSDDELSSEDLNLDLDSKTRRGSAQDDDFDLGELSLDMDEDANGDDLESDLASLDADLDLSMDDDSVAGELGADFDLGDMDLDSAVLSGDTTVNEALNDEYIEQKLSVDADLDLDGGLPLEDDEAPGQTQTLDSLDEDADLDLSSLDQELDALTSDLGGVEEDQDMPVMEEPVTDFDDFEDELEKDEANAELVRSEHTAAADVDDMGEDTMFDEAIKEVPRAEGLDFELPEVNPEDVDDDDLDFLSDSDETATKLDLARAYIDMGDQEGAREIIREVMGEGNDQQKAEAENLLARIEG